MKEVTIYSLVHCPYCVRAKDLFTSKGVAYKEVVAEELPKPQVDKLLARSGMRTFPQIFVGDTLIGGFSELKSLDDSIGIIKYLSELHQTQNDLE